MSRCHECRSRKNYLWVPIRKRLTRHVDYMLLYPKISTVMYILMAKCSRNQVWLGTISYNQYRMGYALCTRCDICWLVGRSLSSASRSCSIHPAPGGYQLSYMMHIPFCLCIVVPLPVWIADWLLENCINFAIYIYIYIFKEEIKWYGPTYRFLVSVYWSLSQSQSQITFVFSFQFGTNVMPLRTVSFRSADGSGCVLNPYDRCYWLLRSALQSSNHPFITFVILHHPHSIIIHLMSILCNRGHCIWLSLVRQYRDRSCPAGSR